MTGSIDIPHSHQTVPEITVLDDLEQQIANDSPTVDDACTFPHSSIARLSAAGLLTWPLKSNDHGKHLSDPAALFSLLVRIGRASLTVGRLYEGHVNAAVLIKEYGTESNRHGVFCGAMDGHISAVWNAERQTGVVAEKHPGGWRLVGEKIFCSGAGSIRYPIVTARLAETQEVIMVMPDISGDRVSVNLSKWRPMGMRGTATGTVRFDDAYVPDDAVIGKPGDYYRSPLFAGGAWRVLAVQLGGLQHIMALHARSLINWKRSDDVQSRTRFAIAGQNLEVARLLVQEASIRVHNAELEPGAIDAYVDAARGAFESLAMSIVAITRRNIGLSTYITPDPLDLVIRDLETYMRQPFLDASRDNAAQWLLQNDGRFTL